MSMMNSWEQAALRYHYGADEQYVAETPAMPAMQPGMMVPKHMVQDSIIYPGLYSASGYDVMNILVRVMARANPVLDIGAVDASCALILCDLQQSDCPVVYANDPFYQMTGYSEREVLGRNCRFLQAPGGRVRKGSKRNHVDKDVLKKMQRAVAGNNELSIEVVNFKKNGQAFTNVVAMIPICWDTAEPIFSVGFQVEKTW